MISTQCWKDGEQLEQRGKREQGAVTDKEAVKGERE
jgi:hypothetical protein